MFIHLHLPCITAVSYTHLPLLIAANCETGGNGAVGEGTIVATNAACGACATAEGAYDMGYVSGIEAAAIGCNWNFAPVSDLFLNWRNTIVNTRCFSNDPDINIEMCKAYIRGVHNQKIACCTNHFPGDGSEEPVSYTHLDVYNRQDPERRLVRFRCSCSYT